MFGNAYRAVMRAMSGAARAIALWWIDPPTWFTIATMRAGEFLDPDAPDDISEYRVVHNPENRPKDPE